MAAPRLGGTTRGTSAGNTNLSFSESAYNAQKIAELEELRNQSYRDSEKFITELVDARFDNEIRRVKEARTIEAKLRADFDNKWEKKHSAEIAKLAKEKKTADAKRKKEIEEELKRIHKEREEEKKHEAAVAEKRARVAEATEYLSNLYSDSDTGWVKKISESFKEIKNGNWLSVVDALGDYADKLDKQIDEIGGYKSMIDTRLYGLRGSSRLGSHWDYYANRITGLAGISPLITQSNLTKNLNEAIEKGIAFNVDQRAFLQTISDKIATTFNAFDSNLLKLVRIQQADTTAARLGVEAKLTEFLNSMYQTTEYLNDLSGTVRESLYEATAQMGAVGGVGFEATVQKWLGSLYSVGMSQGAVGNIASALGMLGSGDVSGLMGNQAMQNLLVMSANRAGLSYAELLVDGLNESNVNTLMEAMVEYLQQIASDNKVVQSQYAAVFGMSMSDIKAARNLEARDLTSIYGTSMGYGNAIDKLYDMAGSMYARTSLGEMMGNVWENIQYSMSAGVASNPALYAIWKAGNLLEDAVGGINIPSIGVLGNFVDMNASLAQIMKVGALGTGMLSSIGQIITAGSAGGLSGRAMLNSFGIGQGISTVTRGSGSGTTTSGASVSQSAYTIGNTSGSDIYETTMAGINEDKNQSLIEAKESSDQFDLEDLDKDVVSIRTLLEGLVSGDAMRVTFSDTLHWN